MQRTAQYWLVLSELTVHDASALGIVLALQFAPQILFLPITGYTADHFDRRKVLIFTQVTMGIFALVLGLLTLSGLVQLWHVYALAFALGSANAFDNTTRHTFVSDLVDDVDLPNAVALNSSSMTMARMIGPAIAGLLIATVGTGWVFLLNASSFVAVIASLLLLRLTEKPKVANDYAILQRLFDGFSYVWARPDLKTIFVMWFLLGTFGFNFPIFISTMSITEFGSNADDFGLLMALLAVGSLLGALLAAGRASATLQLLTMTSAAFGVACAIAALMPNELSFGCALIAIGAAAQTFSTSSNSLVQLSTQPEVRGRVVAILLAVALGGTPIGAPIVGLLVDSLGPRWAMVSGTAAGLVAAAIGALRVRRSRHTATHTGCPPS